VSRESWRELNKRHQAYLLAIYEVDQENERHERELSASTRRSRPADEWRWILYGYDDVGPSPLLARLRKLNLVDQGTGSTFEALEQRAYIVMKHEGYFTSVPWVRMTTKGRKLVRAAVGEKRTAGSLPTGTLREWHWKALVRAYCAGDTGISADVPGLYGNIGWKTWVRLRDYKFHGEYTPLISEVKIQPSIDWHMDYYVLKITEVGNVFYIRERHKYVELYPNIEAPN
jgi:hypothetical protein